MSTGSLQVRTERAKLRAGEVLNDKWRLDSLLGVGGTATVYAATHRNGKRAAIKILHRELVSNGELVARFLREGYVANKLQHPGAVSILDDDRAKDGSVFLVMELLDGYSLDVHTRQGAERMPYEHIFHIADEVLDVLAAAHSRGVIHRDIKPANIFLQRDGRVKVLDFGIARLAEPLSDGSLTQAGSAIGTPSFMPPEQARGRWNLIDARTDVWAMGATIFALIIGERPRRGETVQEELLAAMAAPMPLLVTRAPEVPPEIASLVDCALSFEMEGRWADARAMQQAIRGLFTSGVLRASFIPPARSAGSHEYVEPQLTPQLTTGRPITSGRSEAPPPGVPRPFLRPGLVGAGLGLFAVVLVGLTLEWRTWFAHPPTSRSAAVPPAATAPSFPPIPAATEMTPETTTPTAPPTGVHAQPSVEAGAPQVVNVAPSHVRRPGIGEAVRPPSVPSSRPGQPPEPKPDGDPFDNRF